jgi:2-oxoisovalerate dehydrogenase E2 component (dihydrolipoyl transacylase)
LVGHALIEIEVADENGSAASSTPAETKKEDTSSSSSSSEGAGTVGRTPLGPSKEEIAKSNEKALATPAVRSIAKRHGIELSKVPATGKGGRVLKEDILSFIDGKSKAPAAQETKQAASSSGSAAVGDRVVKIAPLTGVKPDDEVKKLTGMKKAMTKTMTESRSIPFFTFMEEVDATNVMQLRQLLKKSHKNLTLLPFFVKAASLAMKEFPIINSNFNPETDEDGYIKEFVIKKDQNFSIAIDSKDGLTVPNVKRVQDKSILQINSDIISLRERVD